MALLVIAGSALGEDSLQKAKLLRSNGLLSEAKKELVHALFAATSSGGVKSEALLILGEIPPKTVLVLPDDVAKTGTGYVAITRPTRTSTGVDLVPELTRDGVAVVGMKSGDVTLDSLTVVGAIVLQRDFRNQRPLALVPGGPPASLAAMYAWEKRGIVLTRTTAVSGRFRRGWNSDGNKLSPEMSPTHARIALESRLSASRAEVGLYERTT